MQALAVLAKVVALFGNEAYKLKSMEEAHAMANHRSKDLQVIDPGKCDFYRDHFAGFELAADDGAEAVFGNLKATSVYPQVAVLPENPNNHRKLGAVAGEAARR